MNRREAFQKLLEKDKDPLYPQDVARVLGTSSYLISLQAHDDPSLLGFPVRVMGRRTQIPRYSFIKYCREVLGMEV